MKISRLLFGLLLLTGCLVEPVQDNFKTVEPEVDPSFQSNVYYSYNGNQFFPLTDTIWIFNTAYLELRDGAAYRYEVALEGEVIRDYNAPGFIFELPELSSGSYALRVTQLAKSGTNSLADQVGAEYVEYTKEFVLMVTDELYNPEITSIENINGTVRLRWPKVKTGFFEKFRLLKYLNSETFPYREFIITDRMVSGMDDTTYVGGSVTYRLEVTQGGNSTISSGKEFYAGYAPNMTLSAPSPGRLRLTWVATPFQKNVHHFEVTSGGGAVTINNNVDPEARSIEFNGSEPLGFGNMYGIRLVAKVPDGVVNGYDVYRYQEALALGDRLPAYRKILHSSSDDFFYLTYEPSPTSGVLGYFKLDENFQVLDSVVWPFDMYEAHKPVTLFLSPNGQHLYVLKNFQVERRNVNNLSSTTTYPLSALGLPNHYFESFYMNDNFAVSDNNLLLLRLEYSSVITAHVIDTNTQQVIFSLSGAGLTHLSADGKYFISNNALYKFNGTTYEPDFTLPYATIKYVQFMNDNPAEVIVLTTNKVIRFNCDTHTEVAAWDCAPATHSYAHFDQQGKKLLFRGADTRMTVDVLTGAVRMLTSSNHFTVEGDILFTNLNFGLGFGLRNY